MKNLAALLLLVAWMPACFNRTQALPVFATLPEPEASLESIPKFVRGGFTYKVSFRASAPSGGELKSVTVEISKNGGDYQTVRSVSPTATMFEWRVQDEDVPVAKLRIVARNTVGQEGISESDEFEIRSRPPRLLFDNEFQSGSMDTYSRVRTITLTGNCESGVPVQARQLEGATATFDSVMNCQDSFYSLAVTAGSDGVRKIRLEQVDQVGHVTQLDINWTVDSAAPSISSFSLGSDDGGATSASNYLPITLTAADDRTSVAKFCLKYNNAAEPGINDPCWISTRDSSVHASRTGLVFDVSGYFYTIGFAKGTYTIRAWVRDAARNISSPAMAEILYLPPAPPKVTQVYATSSDLPGAPVTKADRTVDSGKDVFIKWKAEDEDLASGPISIYWTENDSTYTLIQAGVNNAAVEGCTLTGGATGCFVWRNSQESGVGLRIRVAAKDSRNSVAFGISNPVNYGDFNFIAGNTDLGTGGDARAAMLNPYGSQPLVVHPSGKIFVSDFRGIVMVDPKDGVLKLIFKLATQVDGPAKTDSLSDCSGCGTVRMVQALALDYQGNILVQDEQNIRKITVTGDSMRIDTLFAGIVPTPNTPSGTLLAAPNGDIYFQADHFKSRPRAGAALQRYIAAEDRVETIKIEGEFTLDLRPGEPVPIDDCSYFGTGFVFDTATSEIERMFHLMKTTSGNVAAESPRKCAVNAIDPENYGQYVSIDPITKLPDGRPGPAAMYRFIGARSPGWREAGNYYLHQGMDGQMYSRSAGHRGNRLIHKYDRESNRWDLLAGHGDAGTCADGSFVIGEDNPVVNNCRITPDAIFVDSRGRVYLLDQNQVRVLLDPENPEKPNLRRILTLVGQPKASVDGVGKKALDARFGGITRVDHYRKQDQDRYVIADHQGLRIREFSPGGDIETVAGSGNQLDSATPSASLSDSALSDLLWGEDSANPVVSVDKETGDLFTIRLQGKTPYKINRNTPDGVGKWEPYGPDSLNSGGNKLYNGPHVLGYDPVSKAALISDHVYCQDIKSGCLGRLIEVTKTGFSVIMQQLPGTPRAAAFCPDGTPLNECAGAGYSLHDGMTSAQLITEADGISKSWLIKKMNNRFGNSVPDRRVVKVESRSGTGTGSPTALLRDFAPLKGTSIGGFIYLPHRKHLYYCGDNGKSLVKSESSLNSEGKEVWKETEFSFPNSQMICSNVGSFVYNETRDSIVFDFEINRLTGVAEYLIPH